MHALLARLLVLVLLPLAPGVHQLHAVADSVHYPVGQQAEEGRGRETIECLVEGTGGRRCGHPSGGISAAGRGLS